MPIRHLFKLFFISLLIYPLTIQADKIDNAQSTATPFVPISYSAAPVSLENANPNSLVLCVCKAWIKYIVELDPAARDGQGFQDEQCKDPEFEVQAEKRLSCSSLNGKTTYLVRSTRMLTSLVIDEGKPGRCFGPQGKTDYISSNVFIYTDCRTKE